MTEKLARAVLWGLGLALGALGLYLAARFLLPWTAPLLAAWLIAALLEPAVSFLVRRRWRRGAAAAVCTFAALGLLLWGLTALVSRGLAAAAELTGLLPALAENLAGRARALQALAEEQLRTAPAPTAALLEGALDALGAAFSALPAQLSRALVSLLSRTAQASPHTLLFLVTAALGSYFFSASFPTVSAFLGAQLPPGFRHKLAGLGAEMRRGFGGVLRAQLILMGMTFCLLLGAYWLLGVHGAALLALLTALIDALPVLGTGVVLLPWGLGCLALGQTRRGLGLVLTWALAELLRNLAQAKLLGDQIGLHPLASLLSVYVGWQVCGVWGMLLFPPLLMALVRFNERGVIRLWKTL